MRQLKYRLRDGNTIVGYCLWLVEEGKFGKWIYSPNNELWSIGYPKIPHKEKDSFTGLLDKQGKEIYEGDIVVIEDTYKDVILDDGTGPIEPFNHLAPVVFQTAEFGVEINQGADIFNSGFWAFCDIARETGQEKLEVIGNIYENKELLVVSKGGL